MAWFRRIVNLARGERLSRDIDRELAFHVAERTDELVARGLTVADARREAEREFGHRTSQRELTREVDVLGWLESLLADLRYAFRSLRASPGFTVVAVLSLGLGIGANTAIFSLINAVMLRALPVAAPEELVRITMGGDQDVFTNPLWEEIAGRQQVVAAFATGSATFDLATGGPARRVAGNWVSGGYFQVLGVRAAAGRVLAPSDDTPGCAAVAVVSHALAQREFGSPHAAVGRSLSLDGHPFAIVGVADRAFSGVDVGVATQVFAPVCSVPIVTGETQSLQGRSRWWLQIMGRLPGGMAAQDASARLAAAAPAIFAATVPNEWSAADQASYRENTLAADDAATGFSSLRTTYRTSLYALLVVVAVVLLIACANVAHLLLARADARQREMAVRIALGAGRGRLVRQLLTESVALAVIGSVVGVVFARWAGGLLVRLLGSRGPGLFLDLGLDLRVLGFTIAVALLTGILFGLAPAWRATRVAPSAAMKAQGRGTTRGGRATTVLVTAQVALSLVLLVAAGLLLRSFQKLATMDPGFRRDGVLVVTMDLQPLRYSEERQREFHRTMTARLRGLPGVRSVSTAHITPISGTSWNSFVGAEGYTPSGERDGLVWFNAVSEEWFATLGTRLLAGRDFTASDNAGSAKVAIVNEAMARKLFGAANPVGRRFHVLRNGESQGDIEIIGMAENSKYRSLRETESATAYLPLAQAEWWGASMNYALRSDGPTEALQTLVAAAVAQASREISLDMTTLTEQVASSLARPRLLATLSGFFGALALLLAMVGLYGTVAYSVTRRRGEIGIRIALGAARARVLRMILGEVGRVLVVGVIAGTLLAIAATRLLTSFLFGLTATDPPTLGFSALALAAVAVVAGAIPALRAARLDPMVVLRED